MLYSWNNIVTVGGNKMDENEKRILLERYKSMPEEEFVEMLSFDEKGYEKDVYQLLLETAKLRGFGIEKKEIVKKALSLQQKKQEKISLQTLSLKQKIIFTIFPIIASYYFIFTPKKWSQRRKEANQCMQKGLIIYAILGLLIKMFSSIRLETIFKYISYLLIIGIPIYIFFQDKKDKKNL